MHLVYAVLGLNLSSGHGDIDRDVWTRCSMMIVELWTTRTAGGKDRSNMEDTSGYGTSGVRLACCCLKSLILVFLPAVKAILTWLRQEILSSSSFPQLLPPLTLTSLFVILNSTITYKCTIQSPLSIFPCHKHELRSSTAHTHHTTHRVLQTPRTACTRFSIHQEQHQTQDDCLPFLASPSSVITHLVAKHIVLN